MIVIALTLFWEWKPKSLGDDGSDAFGDIPFL